MGSTQTGDHHPQEELAKFGYRGKKKQLIENNFRILQYFGNWCVTLFSKIWRFQSTFQYFFNFSIINNFHFLFLFSIFVI
jgi:hypothetical protein